MRGIRQTVLAGHYKFSEKAFDEMEFDDLTEGNIVESIKQATRIEKRTPLDEQADRLSSRDTCT